MKRRLKIGLVGAGPVAERYHVPAIRAVPEVRAWMVADVEATRAERMAELVPFEHWSAKTEDLIGQVDAVIVALPNALHAPITVRFLGAGVHVLCEKPMARNAEECRQMLAAAERTGAVLSIGHNRRFRSNVIEAKRLMQQGLLGEITEIEAEEGSRADWPRSRAYFDPVMAGGGALLDVGIHAIDLIRVLVGEFDEVEYAGNNTATTVESHCELRFRLANGATGSLVCSREQELRQRIVFRGTEGELTVGLWSPELVLARRRGKAFQRFERLRLNPVRRALDASFAEQLFRFAKAILENGPVPVPGLDGLKAVEVVERAYRLRGGDRRQSGRLPQDAEA
jgi:predicted dehydrogenase